MFERLLLMGSPGSGKSQQLINVAKYLEPMGIKMYAIDLEDKLEAMLINLGTPKNLDLNVAFTWEELKTGYKDEKGKDVESVADKIVRLSKPGEWIAIDRVDLSWPMVQRWYTQAKYQEELSDLMLAKAKNIKKSFMVAPRFDQGSWQVINEAYESFILAIMYKSRCNILMTTGIKVPEDNPMDIYGSLKVAPRGQKELPHQPHSTFLLSQDKVGRTLNWYMTTGKDLPGRRWFDREDLFDFSIQYLDEYYKV